MLLNFFHLESLNLFFLHLFIFFVYSKFFSLSLLFLSNLLIKLLFDQDLSHLFILLLLLDFFLVKKCVEFQYLCPLIYFFAFLESRSSSKVVFLRRAERLSSLKVLILARSWISLRTNDVHAGLLHGSCSNIWLASEIEFLFDLQL